MFVVITFLRFEQLTTPLASGRGVLILTWMFDAVPSTECPYDDVTHTTTVHLA